MKKFLTKQIEYFKSHTFIDLIPFIGGLLILAYIPLLIGLIWFETLIWFKAIMTNSILIIGLKVIDNAHKNA